MSKPQHAATNGANSSTTSTTDPNTTSPDSLVSLGSSGALTRNSTPPRNNPALGRYKRLSDAWDEFSASSSHYHNVEETVEELERTREELNAKEVVLRGRDKWIKALKKDRKEQIEALRGSRKGLVNEFQTRYSEWTAASTGLNKEIRVLTEKLETEVRDGEKLSEKVQELSGTEAWQRKEIDELRAQLENKAAEVHTLVTQCNLQISTVDLANARVACLEDQLRRVENFANSLELEEFNTVQFSNDMDGLSICCDDFVRTYFLGDLPPEDLADDRRWLQKTNALHTPLSLPPGNTPQAQRARMAVASNILATRICANLFKVVYMPEIPATTEINGLVLQLCKCPDPEKQVVCRANLLSAWPQQTQDEAIERILLSTRKDVSRLLVPFVVGDKEKFPTDLDSILRKAVKIWKLIQRSKKLVIASVADDGHWSWLSEGEYDKECFPPESLPEGAGQGYFVMNLFPRAYDPTDMVVLYPGKALWSDQKTVVVAKRDHRRWEQDKEARDMENMPSIQQRRSERIGRWSMSPPSTPLLSSFSDRARAGHGRVASTELRRSGDWGMGGSSELMGRLGRNRENDG
ncbi:MAG: hypothetical protein M1840_004746 [Geoglossum simile]|nr:MAG: hypothetical protein M1840_004746 [Geoglossum simile]